MALVEPLVDIADLEKTFGETFKLGPVNLQLIPGETVAFLGKNGSGKTTLFQLITGNIAVPRKRATTNNVTMVTVGLRPSI